MNPTRRISLYCLLAAVVWAFASGVVFAQMAPEGNAHPRTQVVTEAGEVASPFGQSDAMGATDGGDPKPKHEFAKNIDVGPLRGLAVFHNGRVKILETLARETVRKITGRKDYQDFIHSTAKTGAGSERVEKVSYDPIFTLLDLIIDPFYYADKPLIAVNYLPLREEILEMSFPGDDNKPTRERWMRMTRVTPRMLQAHVSEIVNKHEDKPAYRRALAELQMAAELWGSSKANMVLVAPPSKDDPWRNISTLPDDHPARVAALALGAGWREMDARKVNDAIRSLANELPKINPDIYPDGKPKIELMYNHVRPFEWGFWVYFLSLVSLLLAFGTARKTPAVIGAALLFIALGLHAFGFITRCIIAERFAIQNQFESMTGVSLFAAALGAALMLGRKQWLFGAAAAAVGFLVLITATQDVIPGRDIEKEAAILNTSVLLKYHVTTVLVSYGLISLGFIISLFYIGVHYLGKSKAAAATELAPELAQGLAGIALNDDAAIGSRERTLKDLDTAQMTVLQLAFWTLGVGILLGAWWADHSWGRWWAFDPKETWALITWIVYLIVIHIRQAAIRNRGLVTAWLSIIGFFVMLWTYFGVNLILPGLHAYA